MSESQDRIHRVRTVAGEMYRLNADQAFAAELVRVLLSSGSRQICLERFMDMMHRSFPDIRFSLFILQDESDLSLVCTRPQQVGKFADHLFTVLSDQPCCIVSDLSHSEIWQKDYAPFFPDSEQCLLFSTQVHTRHYTLMVESSSAHFEDEIWFQKLIYTCDIVRSVSDHMTYVEQHYETVEQSQQREKFASLGQLAAGVAHEINNPLAFIMSNLSTLSAYQGQFRMLIHQTDSIKNESVQDLFEDSEAILSETYEGLTRIQSIVGSLNVYDHETGSSERQVDLRDVISTALNMIHGETRLRAEIDYSVPDEPFYVTGHPSRLQQVIIHLVMNALQSITHGHGQISLCLAYKTSELELGKKMIVLDIRDNGRGIAEDDLCHIFEPFFTTKTVGDGAGLGLSVAKEIVEEHHGRISIESGVGVGTKVRVLLPGVVCSAGKKNAV